jgi:hypothetical protein
MSSNVNYTQPTQQYAPQPVQQYAPQSIQPVNYTNTSTTPKTSQSSQTSLILGVIAIVIAIVIYFMLSDKFNNYQEKGEYLLPESLESELQSYQKKGDFVTRTEYKNIKGEQGIQGPLGPLGPQGIQGAVGPIGPVGPVGPAADYSKETDFVLGNSLSDLGDTGKSRALTKLNNKVLNINNSNDFSGGVKITGNVTVDNELSAVGDIIGKEELTVNKNIYGKQNLILDNILRVKGYVQQEKGFGPYIMKFQNGYCLDAGQFGDGGKGALKCGTFNNNHLWYYDPIPGKIRSHDNKCLHAGETQISLQACENGNARQVFRINADGGFKPLAYSKSCLDVGQSDRWAECSNEDSQKVNMYEYW